MRAALAQQAAEPTPIDLVHELHTALFGGSWARPESPKVVWEELLDRVRALVAGRCSACEQGYSTAARQAAEVEQLNAVVSELAAIPSDALRSDSGECVLCGFGDDIDERHAQDCIAIAARRLTEHGAEQ